jgi:hypothetical protein
VTNNIKKDTLTLWKTVISLRRKEVSMCKKIVSCFFVAFLFAMFCSYSLARDGTEIAQAVFEPDTPMLCVVGYEIKDVEILDPGWQELTYSTSPSILRFHVFENVVTMPEQKNRSPA